MKERLQFLKFASVGVVGTALHYAVFILLVSGLRCDPAIASMSGAFFGAVFNYKLNHRFTFRSDRSHKEALPRFFLMAGVGILLNGSIVKILTIISVNYLISQVAATLAILVLNFFLSKLWVFQKNR